MIQAPVVFSIDGSRGKIAGIAVGPRQGGIVHAVDAPGLVAHRSLRGEVRVGGLLSAATFPVERVIENAAVPARVHPDLADAGVRGGREDVVAVEARLAAPHDQVVFVAQGSRGVVDERHLHEIGRRAQNPHLGADQPGRAATGIDIKRVLAVGVAGIDAG